jgi:hypothetical protein
MTQILGVLTHDYIVVASDRKLTDSQDPLKTVDEDTCKLVNYRNMFGVAYTGYAELEGQPTHEWIACKLAEAPHDSVKAAILGLAESASKAMAGRVPIEQTFLFAGWAATSDSAPLSPYAFQVSNVLQREQNKKPDANFNVFVMTLSPKQPWYGLRAGRWLSDPRARRLRTRLKRIVENSVSPRAVMHTLVDEIRHTAGITNTVGNKVLGFCIPKADAERTFQTGRSMMVAALPDRDTTTFCYFDGQYSEMKQHGPTTIIGSRVFTVETEHDPANHPNRSSMKIVKL